MAHSAELFFNFYPQNIFGSIWQKICSLEIPRSFIYCLRNFKFFNKISLCHEISNLISQEFFTQKFDFLAQKLDFFDQKLDFFAQKFIFFAKKFKIFSPKNSTLFKAWILEN